MEVSRQNPQRASSDPLWLRTQRRLQNMETFAARHRITSDGSSMHIQLLEERIQLASRHLVLLLKEMEEREGN